MSLNLLPIDITKYISENFLDIKSQTRFSYTNKENYENFKEYLKLKYNIEIKDLYISLNLSCNRFYHSKYINRYFIDDIRIHFKDTCKFCISKEICQECKSYPVQLVNTACEICIFRYGGKYRREIFGELEESDCSGKNVCGYDSDQFRGECCFYECDFCGIIQNEKNFNEIEYLENIDRNGWMIKKKIYSEETKSLEEIIEEKKISKELIELDIYYNYIYACSKCYLSFPSIEKEKYSKTFIDLENYSEDTDDVEDTLFLEEQYSNDVIFIEN